MKLRTLVETSTAVASTRGRKAKVALLADLVGNAAESERALVVSYLAGELPQGKVGLGWSVLSAFVDGPFGPGGTAEVGDVDRTIEAVRAEAGAGSRARRHAHLAALLGEADEAEARFVVRLVLGELRQGALTALVLEALAVAAGRDAPAVRRAAMLEPHLPTVVAAAFESEAALGAFRLRPFNPVLPMLAQTAETPAEAIERLGSAAVEEKLDGARVQVHRDGDSVRVYSRAQNEVTHAVPEVVELALGLAGERFVLDGETIALDRQGAPLPFQVTMKRFGRRQDVAKARQGLPLTTRFFDCLLLGEEQLIDAPYAERMRALEDLVGPEHRVRNRGVASAGELGDFLGDTLAAGHEGVMVKSLDAPYEAGSRGAGWLKLKQVHTLDLVVLAAEWGSGRRSGRLSNLHLGARDEETGEFVMLGKTFKGLTDKVLAWQTEALLERETHRGEYAVHVRPELVVEIAFNDVQRSPQYPGGVALRFARVKTYRDDKRADEADTIATVRALLPRSAGD